MITCINLPSLTMDNLDAQQGGLEDDFSRSSKRQARLQPPSGVQLMDDSLGNFSDISSLDGDDDIALFGQNFAPEEVNDISPDDVDSLLAHELTQLSMADREKVYYDIHGVSSDVVEETPELLLGSLQLFQIELDEMNDAVAYKKALEMDSSYVQSIKLKLRFLRAERFDVHKAAVRFVKFFEIKMNLFGPDLLVKDITQDDLEKDDMEVLYEGMGMDLPFRDRAGRLILFQLAQPVTVPIRTVMRKSLYASMALSEDEETQKKGVVFISYIVGQVLTWQQVVHRQMMNREWGKLLLCLPLRFEAWHICADSILWRPIFAVFKLAAGMFARMRVREHMGNHKEVQFSLMSFGIPAAGFPVTENGEVIRQLCRDRWKKRGVLEQMLKQTEIQRQQEQGRHQAVQQPRELVRVGTPGENDVLLGRGKAFYAHVGNVRLRNIVIEQMELYEGAEFSGKQQVSREVVNLIMSQGGKFLKDDGAGWVEVDHETAMKKVSHSFRTLRSLKNTGGKFPGSSSGKRRKDDDFPS